MKEKNLKEVESAVVNQVNVAGPGATLSNARKAAGLSLTEIATRLNLRETMLQMIENDNYDKMPELVFVRGYLRAYANLLHLPADEIIAEFNQLDLKRPVTVKSTKQYQPIQSSRNKGKNLRRFTFLIILMFLISIGLWWNSHQMQTNGETSDLLTLMMDPSQVTEQQVDEQTPTTDFMDQIELGSINTDPMQD